MNVVGKSRTWKLRIKASELAFSYDTLSVGEQTHRSLSRSSMCCSMPFQIESGEYCRQRVHFQRHFARRISRASFRVCCGALSYGLPRGGLPLAPNSAHARPPSCGRSVGRCRLDPPTRSIVLARRWYTNKRKNSGHVT
jgi:hypothetical protein